MENNKKNIKLIVGIVAAVVLVAIVVLGVFLYKVGAFNGPADKILIATKNTFSETTPLVDALNVSDYVKSGKYEVDFEGYKDKDSVELVYGVDKKKQQLSGEVKLSYLPNFAVSVTLDNGILSGNTPLLRDYIFEYDYNDSTSGALVSMVGITKINEFNEYIKEFEKLGDYENSIVAEASGIFVSDFCALQFEKAEKKEKCKGYITHLSNADLQKITADLERVVQKNTNNSKVNEVLDQIYREVSEVGDVDLTVYISKNKLKEIIVVAKKTNEKVQIVFDDLGIRWQNWQILYNDEVAYELKGGIDEDGTESYSFYDENKTEYSMSFDCNSGAVEIFDDGSFRIDGTLVNDGKNANLEIADYEGYTLKVNVSKNVDFKEYSGTKRFNVGNASKDEFMGLVGDVILVPEIRDILSKFIKL